MFLVHQKNYQKHSVGIGEDLYRQGGWTMMLRAYHQAGTPEVIEKAWEGIGTWKG